MANGKQITASNVQILSRFGSLGFDYWKLFAFCFLMPGALLAVFSGAQLAHAQEIQYSEFAPERTSTSVNVSSVATPYQAFTPFNDSISGIDLWIDNSGSSGFMNVNLRRDSDNQLLKSKTVTVPTIPQTEGGQQFHISFGESIPLTDTDVYNIEIISSLPSLNLYYSPLVDILEHNSTFLPSETVLPAYLGTEEQEFVFKYGLYESSSGTQPILSNVTANVISPSQTDILFNADQPVDYRVLFAQSGETPATGTSFTGIYASCPIGLPQCSVSLTTTPGTAYDYQLTAKNQSGIESIAGGSFTSSQSAPPVELIITNLQATSVTNNSAVISWTTNIAANSSVLLRIEDELGIRAVFSFGDDIYELEHAVVIDPVLAPNTLYFADVTSFDTYGGQTIQQIAFTTLSAPPPADEEPTAGGSTSTGGTSTESGGTAASSGGASGNGEVTVDTGSGGGEPVSLSWGGSSGGGGYRIDIFDGNNNLVTSIETGSPSAEVEGLGPGEYRAVVYENDGGVFKKAARQATFVVPEGGKARLFSIIFGLLFISVLTGVLVILKRKRSAKPKNAVVYIDPGIEEKTPPPKVRKLTTKVEPVKKKKPAPKKKKAKKAKTKSKKSGFTLIEILISTAILVVILIFIGLFGSDVLNFGLDFTERFEVQQEVELTMAELVPEIRSISQSNEGSYPIVTAGTSTFTFYSDKESDGLIEQIRYFLDQDALKKGTIVPSGAPLGYDPADEVIVDVVHNIVAGTSSIFSYYDKNFTGTEPPLSDPVMISDIRMIEVSITAQQDTQTTPISFSTRATPRNLREDTSGTGGAGSGTEADDLVIDTSGANIGGGGNKELRGVTLENTGTSNITIDTMTLTWTNGKLIEEIKIKGVQVWKHDGVGTPDGRQPTGTEIDIQDYTISSGNTDSVDKLKFNGNMTGDTFTISAKMSDGSSTSTASFSP